MCKEVTRAQGPHQRLYFRIMTEEHSGHGMTSQAGVIAGQELLVHNLITWSVGLSSAGV